MNAAISGWRGSANEMKVNLIKRCVELAPTAVAPASVMQVVKLFVLLLFIGQLFQSFVDLEKLVIFKAPLN